MACLSCQWRSASTRACKHEASSYLPKSRRRPLPRRRDDLVVNAGDDVAPIYASTYDYRLTSSLLDVTSLNDTATQLTTAFRTLSASTAALSNAWLTFGDALATAGNSLALATNAYITYGTDSTGSDSGALYFPARVYGQFTGEWNDLRDIGPFAAPLQPERVAVINQRAKALLLQHLTPAQQQTWLASAYFDLTAPSGRRYRLTRAMAHNVFLLDAHGGIVREYCAYAKDPGGTLPVEDNLFAQKMLLMFEEREFLARANTWDRLNGRREFVGQGADADRPVVDLLHREAA